MSIYASNTNHANHRDQLDRAYLQAGLKPPTRAGEIEAALYAEPALDDVAVALAREALTDRPDPADWLADALTRVHRAQAAAALRDAMASCTRAVQDEQIPSLITAAAKDLTPAVAKVAASLTKAAKALPADPFDLDAVVEMDATKEMKAAQNALAALGVFAGVHEVGSPRGSYTPALAQLLPIVELPAAVVEVVARGYVGDAPTVNGPELAGTRAIRRLDQTASEHNVDRALVEVARGGYPGCSIQLADWAGLAERRDNASRAFVRQRSTEENPRRRVAV